MDSGDKPKSRAEKVAYWKCECVRRNKEYRQNWKKHRDAILEREKCRDDGIPPNLELDGRYRSAVKWLFENWEIDYLVSGCHPFPPEDDEGLRMYLYQSRSDHGVEVLESNIFYRTVAIGNLGWTDWSQSDCLTILLITDMSIPLCVHEMQTRGNAIYSEIKERIQGRTLDEESDSRSADHEHRISGTIQILPHCCEIVSQVTDHIHIRVPLHELVENKGKIKSLINGVLNQYEVALKNLGHRQTRSRFRDYKTYFKVWDLREEADKPWKEIVVEVFGHEICEKDRENRYALQVRIQELTEKAIDNYNRAKALIEGGWREIR